MKRPRTSNRPGYEASDIAPKNVGYAALSLFAGIALSAGLVAGLLALFDHAGQRPAATALETAPLAPPLPRLEIDGKADRTVVEADAARKLNGYAWVDRSAGTVRIPIARAMELLAARGWPDAPQATGAP
jgi:hypothetical protein